MPGTNSLIRQIPNFFTALNMLIGFTSIIMVLVEHWILASIMIGVCAVFDFLDGFFARLFKAGSSFGKEFDSLADMVSFGVAPAVIMFKLCMLILFRQSILAGFFMSPSFTKYLFLFSSFLLCLFAGIRLAKYNLKTDKSRFMGLPTPANALFIASLPLILDYHNEGFNNIFNDIILNKFFLLYVIFIHSILMVVNFPMFTIKFKNAGFSENKIRYIFIIAIIIIFVIFEMLSLRYIAIPAIVYFYIILSAVNNWVVRIEKIE